MTPEALRARGHGTAVMVSGHAIDPHIRRLPSGSEVGVLELEQPDGARIFLLVLNPTPIEPGQEVLAGARVDITAGKVAALATSQAVVAL
jgi:ribosomal protein L2